MDLINKYNIEILSYNDNNIFLEKKKINTDLDINLDNILIYELTLNKYYNIFDKIDFVASGDNFESFVIHTNMNNIMNNDILVNVKVNDIEYKIINSNNIYDLVDNSCICNYSGDSFTLLFGGEISINCNNCENCLNNNECQSKINKYCGKKLNTGDIINVEYIIKNVHNNIKSIIVEEQKNLDNYIFEKLIKQYNNEYDPQLIKDTLDEKTVELYEIYKLIINQKFAIMQNNISLFNNEFTLNKIFKSKSLNNLKPRFFLMFNKQI